MAWNKPSNLYKSDTYEMKVKSSTYVPIAFNIARTHVTIKNTSSRPLRYVITLEINDTNNMRIGTIQARSELLRPGQSQRVNLEGNVSAAGMKGFAPLQYYVQASAS